MVLWDYQDSEMYNVNKIYIHFGLEILIYYKIFPLFFFVRFKVACYHGGRGAMHAIMGLASLTHSFTHSLIHSWVDEINAGQESH